MHGLGSGLKLNQDVLAFAVLVYAVRKPALAPLIYFIDDATGIGNHSRHLFDEVIDFLLRGIRLDDKQLFVNTHSSSFVLASSATIEFRHGLFDAFSDYCTNSVGREADQFVQFFFLLPLERRKHILGRVSERAAWIDAHTDPGKFPGSETFHNRLGSVVRAAGTLRFDLQRRPREIQFIKNQDQIPRRQFMLFHQRPQRGATQIHIRDGLCKHDRLPLDGSGADQGFGIRARYANPGLFSQTVDGHEAQVMRRQAIFLAGIAQACHQKHFRDAGLLLLPGLGSGRFVFLLALLDDFGLGGGSGDVGGSGRFLFGLEADHVSDHGFGRAQ
jgi:hypothetical protein